MKVKECAAYEAQCEILSFKAELKCDLESLQALTEVGTNEKQAERLK